jgi:hypothetical protein
MHGGSNGAFGVEPDLFSDPQQYKGMSGAVLTYTDEPLAVQTQAWPGPPTVVEFRRLEFLLAEAAEILSRHNIRTLEIPDDTPQLFAVDKESPAETQTLPVPIVEVGSDDIDTIRTHDFTL